MIRLVKTELVPLTMQVAEQHANLQRVPGERDIRSGRREHLIAALKAGLFYGPSWARVTLTSNGITYRCDGQASSRVLCDHPSFFPRNLFVTIQHFECDNIEDLAELFWQFNNPVSTRTPSELMLVHGRIHETLNDVRKGTMRDVVAGIAFALSVDTDQKFSTEDRARLIHSNTDFIRWAAPFVATPYGRRVGVAAAIYKTYIANEVAAEEFWTLVKNESHPDHQHSTRRYAVLVRSAISEIHRLRHTVNKKFADNRYLYITGIQAWNQYRRNETKNFRYLENMQIPAVFK